MCFRAPKPRFETRKIEPIYMNTEALHTPLASAHKHLEGRMVSFAGWWLPVQYDSILKEHQRVRHSAALFDVCHMGEILIQGPQACADLQKILACPVENLEVHQARYGFLLNPEGGVLDDLIVFRIGREAFWLVVNAGPAQKDFQWVRQLVSPGTTCLDISAETAKIDLQGPLSPQALLAVADTPDAVEALGRFRLTRTSIAGTEVLLSRTGYTGEKGYEIFCPPEKAEALWALLLEQEDVSPAGLGARDTLRLEKGLPLYGHELSEDITPLEAGLERFIGWGEDFIGKEALLKQKEAGLRQCRIGFVCEGRRAAREEYAVEMEGLQVGTVSSGAFSPILKRGIGMAYVRLPAAPATKTPLTLTSGKARIAAEVTDYPFL